MDKIEFKIFTAKKVQRITPNKIVLGLFVPSFLLLFYTNDLQNADFLYGLGQVLMFSAIASGLYYTVTKHTRIEPLNGALDKNLTFDLESITVGEAQYFLHDLKKIDFLIQDYFNKWNYTRDFNACRSNGIDNKLILTLKGGQIIESKFQLMHESQMKKLENELIEYNRAGVLHFLKLIDLLGIDDYDDIQELKKRLPPT
jgi:hypothetical protein